MAIDGIYGFFLFMMEVVFGKEKSGYKVVIEMGR